jgi:hypothetical protein
MAVTFTLCPDPGQARTESPEKPVLHGIRVELPPGLVIRGHRVVVRQARDRAALPARGVVPEGPPVVDAPPAAGDADVTF